MALVGGGGGGACFAISATSTAGATFDCVPVAEGVNAWSQSDEQLTSIPTHLLGGTLLRTDRASLRPGSALAVTAAGADARLFVVAEASRGGGAPGRDGGLVRALAAAPGWLADGGGAPSCGATDSAMTVFSTLVQRDVPALLPEITEADAAFFLIAVPVVIGSFGVSVLSSSSASYDRMAVVEEGVVAWRDRDHRFMGVPSFLLGGVLFQGPYKDVPDGTVLSVRPNARSRVYAILERSGSGGLAQSLPAQGWKQEAGAPRWHDTPTMVTFGRDCAAGCALTLPPTKGPQAVLSLVVVPCSGAPVAPVEVSCTGTASAHLQQLEFLPLAEGAAWGCEGQRLSKVPEWMLGASYLRGLTTPGGPPAGTRLGIRAAPPSVVYAIVEAQREGPGGGPGRSGGLLPDALATAGWEKRAEAPEASASPSGDGGAAPAAQLAVYAKRVAAREAVALPALTEDGACLALAVKVDVEAFDATAETSGGVELQRADMQETVIAWSDRLFRYAWVPTQMVGGILFRGPHCATPSGTVISVTASGACRVYVVVEAELKGGKARDGGFLQSLPRGGWRAEAAAPSWNDSNSVMKVFSMKAVEGAEVRLPPTAGDVVFSVVVVNIASSSDRLADELRQAFRSWDKDGKGGIRKEDLESLLGTLCPALDDAGRAAVLAEADPRGTGRVPYDEFVNRVILGSPGA